MRSSGARSGLTICRAASRYSFRPRLLVVVTTSLWLAGCGQAPPRHDATAPLRFGLFVADATGSREQLATRYEPVVAYLQARLARPIDFVVSGDAGAMLARFESGGFDVAFHRAFAFPHAQQRVGAIPLATRSEDRQATSVLLSRATDPRQTLQDFRGARLEFSLRLGSSYVMGRHYLEQQHIDLDTFFGGVHYSKVADEAIGRLRHEQADLCVVNSLALLRMIASGALRASDVKIVAETPPHVGELWFASTALPDTVRMQVRDAFLALSTDDPGQAAVLSVLGASAYVPTTLDDYRELTDLMRQMQLLDGDISQLQ